MLRMGGWMKAVQGRPRFRVLLLALGGTCALYSVGGLLALMSGNEHAPWLPKGGGDGSYLWFVLVAVVVVGFVGGLVHGYIDSRRGKRGPGGRTPVPAYLLGVQWLFSGWRLVITGLFIGITLAPFAVGMTISDIEQQTEGNLLQQLLLVSVFSSFWLLWALILKGRELRRGKERMRVADEYLAIREERLHQEFTAMTEKFLLEQQEWRSEVTAELYRQILEQQARGVLPCPSCDEGRKSA